VRVSFLYFCLKLIIAGLTTAAGDATTNHCGGTTGATATTPTACAATSANPTAGTEYKTGA